MVAINNKYYEVLDTLLFASALINSKESFYLRGSELKLLQKLILDSNLNEEITITSKSISNDLFTSITSIDKLIQQLKEKCFIITTNKNKKRTIFINWNEIKIIDQLRLKYLSEN